MAVLKEMEKVGEVSVADHSDLPHLQYLEHLMLAYDETILKQKKIVFFDVILDSVTLFAIGRCGEES